MYFIYWSSDKMDENDDDKADNSEEYDEGNIHTCKPHWMFIVWVAIV